MFSSTFKTIIACRNNSIGVEKCVVTSKIKSRLFKKSGVSETKLLAGFEKSTSFLLF